jgi:hypothetical protein
VQCGALRIALGGAQVKVSDGLLYRIKAGEYESYLVRSSLDSVMKVAREKARQLPFGQKVSVFCGEALIAETTRLSLFDELEEELVSGHSTG